MPIINVAEDFSEYPGGRYPEDGDANGTDFRRNFLIPAMKFDERSKIILDGTRGYPSSFLEEAFGGLVRDGYAKEDILNKFEFVANSAGYSRYVDSIKRYIDLAAEKMKAG